VHGEVGVGQVAVVLLLSDADLVGGVDVIDMASRWATIQPDAPR
jgi:hypothetical protein